MAAQGAFSLALLAWQGTSGRSHTRCGEWWGTRTCTPRPGILMDGVVQAEPQLQPWPRCAEA